MSKGRFLSHSQHQLTACVPCTVNLCCWDTPPTTGGLGGRHSQCEAQGGPHGEQSVLQGGGGTHTHATGVMHSGCDGTGHM